MYKLSLPGSGCSTAKSLTPTGLPVRPAKGGQAMRTRSGSSTGSRFSSGGGQLKNLCCAMTGIKAGIPRWFGLRLALSIPLTLTLTSFLPMSELTHSLPISCSSSHHWCPAHACCPAAESSVCMMRTQVKHTFLLLFCP